MGTVEFVSVFEQVFKGQREFSRDEIFQQVKQLLIEEFELPEIGPHYRMWRSI